MRAHRLARHHLVEPAERSRLVEVVGEVCGVHAQVMSAAELSLGLRVAGVTRDDVRAELWERRGLVKTHGIRGTLHLFPAAELGLWRAALRANVPPRGGMGLEAFDLGPVRMDALVAAIGEVLGGEGLTGEELAGELAGRVGPWAAEEVFPAFGGKWPRWRVALGAAAQAGVLCFGPNRGTRVTYVRPDRWVGPVEEVDGASALAEVLRRFLGAYGPATHRDFAQWFGMDPAAASELVRSLGGELVQVDVEGWRGWLPAGVAEGPWPRPRASLRLLPHFDCYVIGSHPRDRLVPPEVQAVALERGRRRADLVGPTPVLLVDGAVAGVWRRAGGGRRGKLLVEPFGQLAAARRRWLEAEAARVGEVLGAEVSVSVGAVETGRHL